MTENGPNSTNLLDAYVKLSSSSQSMKDLQASMAAITEMYCSQLREIKLQAPQISNSLSSFANALKVSASLTANCASLLNSMESIKLNFSPIAESMTTILQPQVFNTAKQLVSQFASLIPPMDFSGISEAYKNALKSWRYIDTLSKAEWPLFLEDREMLISQILLLDNNTDSETLRANVTPIAQSYLDESWLNDVASRWGANEIISEETRHLLLESLERHKSEDYLVSVLILMNLIEGFASSFFKASCKASNINQELFDYEADKHSLNPLINRDTEKIKKLCTKDKIIALLLQTENGWYTWEAASSYIIDIVFTNSDINNISLRNPLRNKICHGSQTNYDTWEHSAKSILATDIILRLGAVAATTAKAETSAV